MNIDQAIEIIKAVIIDRIYNNKFEVTEILASDIVNRYKVSIVTIKVDCNENFKPEITICVSADDLYIVPLKQFPIKLTYTDKVGVSLYKIFAKIVSRKRDQNTFLKLSKKQLLDQINHELKTK
jgi:hypothetical protein